MFIIINIRSVINQIKLFKTINFLMTGDGDLFEQIKLLRKKSPAFPASVDVEQGEEIPTHFQNTH